MTHCTSGVEKGIRKGGNPVEVMGLLLGRPLIDSDSSNTTSSSTSTPATSTDVETSSFIVTDVFPLPIEGFETRVVADDQNVLNHMIELAESLERQGRMTSEKFMGWYHSHPFEYMGEDHGGHCYLSQTDVTTQLQWQRSEDPYGNPFLAIVLDPLRSLARGIPELKAFRVYPPEYSPTDPNGQFSCICPDGTIITEEKTRLERWGNCWSRYYELKIEYFMSNSARKVMNIWKNKFMWMKHLSVGSSKGPAAVHSDRVKELSKALVHVDLDKTMAGTASGGSTTFSGSTNISNSVATLEETKKSDCKCATLASLLLRGRKKTENSELDAACEDVVHFAASMIQGSICQVIQDELFSSTI